MIDNGGFDLPRTRVRVDRWRPVFVCPHCGRASSHPKDVEHRYCSCCGSPPLLPKDCPHVRRQEQ
ncbi:MAG TPA: hypothetical protein VKG45_00585 [Actinomycetes bacterium]|nr:hypothetical protein [Actinomycetes bacterium]